MARGRHPDVTVLIMDATGGSGALMLHILKHDDDTTGAHTEDLYIDTRIANKSVLCRLAHYSEKWEPQDWKECNPDMAMVLIPCDKDKGIWKAADKTWIDNVNGSLIEQKIRNAPLIPLLLVGVNANSPEIMAADKKFVGRDQGLCFLECCCYHPWDCRTCCCPMIFPKFMDRNYGQLLMHEYNASGYREINIAGSSVEDESKAIHSEVSKLFRVAVATAASKGEAVFCWTWCSLCAPIFNCDSCYRPIHPMVEPMDERMYPCCCNIWFPCHCFSDRGYIMITEWDECLGLRALGCKDRQDRPCCDEAGWCGFCRIWGWLCCGRAGCFC